MAPRESAVFQLIRQTDEKHEAGHHRLRTDWREHEERLLKLESVQAEHGFALKGLQTAAPDFSRMSLTPGAVATIITAIIGIVGGQLASTWGMRSDIRDIRTHMDLQVDADRNLQKLQDDRSQALRSAVDEIKKKQDLQQLEIQNLRETILNQRRER